MTANASRLPARGDIIHPEGLSGEWTIVDRLDYAGATLRVVERDGHRFTLNGTIPVSEDHQPYGRTLAEELERHPTIMRHRAEGRPIIEAYRACLIDRHRFAPLNPDWTRDARPYLYLIDENTGKTRLAGLLRQRLIQSEGQPLTVECLDTDQPLLERASAGMPVEWIIRRQPQR